MELIAEVKTYNIYKKCPKCKHGLMSREYSVGIKGDLVRPSAYGHKCNECGYTDFYEKCYPYQESVPIEPLEER